MENNKRIASLFRQIAALLDEQGVAFKPNAYRRAAQVLDDLDKDVAELGDEKELQKISGIGEATAAKIVEYLQTGTIKNLEKLRAEFGDISAELLDIDDMGPKRVREFQKELGIKTVADLIKAAEEGKLRNLSRMSEHLEQKILENARKVTERSKRYPREEIVSDVEEILKAVRAVPGVEKAEAAGSYRRQKPTVGDVDILVVTKDPEKVIDLVAHLPLVKEVVAKGGTKLSFNLQNLLRVDIRFVKEEEWGSALLYFTGDKEHNISLRKKAIERGWKLNEYCLSEGEKVIAQKSEEEIYTALGLPWVDPTKRTGVLPVS
ncbi:MAG: polymerase [Candidatus Peribacteria bacterium]|nr:polymerase [Candidatus Peribacteria bacterium]